MSTYFLLIRETRRRRIERMSLLQKAESNLLSKFQIKELSLRNYKTIVNSVFYQRARH